MMLDQFIRWADNLRSELAQRGIEASAELVHHDGGSNDSVFFEIWTEQYAGRLTAYESTPDIDFLVLNRPDGHDILNLHTETSADFTGGWAQFASLFNIPPAWTPAYPHAGMDVGDPKNVQKPRQSVSGQQRSILSDSASGKRNKEQLRKAKATPPAES